MIFVLEFLSKHCLVDSSASTMHAYFVLGAAEMRQVSLYVLPCFCKALLPASELPTSSARFNSFFELRIRWINEANTAQSSGVVKLLFFDTPFVFRFVALLLPRLSTFLATSSQAWMSCVSSSTSPGPCIPIRRFFVQCGESCEPCSRI